MKDSKNSDFIDWLTYASQARKDEYEDASMAKYSVKNKLYSARLKLENCWSSDVTDYLKKEVANLEILLEEHKQNTAKLREKLRENYASKTCS